MCHTCLAPHPGRSDDEVAKREMARAADMDLRVALSVLAERTAELEALKARACDGCAHKYDIDFGVRGCLLTFGLRPGVGFACNRWEAKP